MDGIIEAEKRCQIIFIASLNFLHSNLEAVQHGAFCSGVVFACVAVLTDLRKDLLDQQELIRHEREIDGKFLRAGIALDVQHGILEGKQIAQHGITLGINAFQQFRFTHVVPNGAVAMLLVDVYFHCIYAGRVPTVRYHTEVEGLAHVERVLAVIFLPSSVFDVGQVGWAPYQYTVENNGCQHLVQTGAGGQRVPVFDGQCLLVDG